MKTILTMIALALLLSGCAIFYDLPHTDAASGNAQATSWDKQVAFQDYRHANRIPEGLGGTPAENAVEVYIKSFLEKTERTDILAEGFKATGSD